jgi:hypothetical protein
MIDSYTFPVCFFGIAHSLDCPRFGCSLGRLSKNLNIGEYDSVNLGPPLFDCVGPSNPSITTIHKCQLHDHIGRPLLITYAFGLDELGSVTSCKRSAVRQHSGHRNAQATSTPTQNQRATYGGDVHGDRVFPFHHGPTAFDEQPTRLIAP